MRSAILLLSLLALSACESAVQPQPDEPREITFTPSYPLQLWVGEANVVRASVTGRADTTLARVDVHWSSSDSTIVRVLDEGFSEGGDPLVRVWARTVGQVFVRASAGAVADSFAVTVVPHTD